MHGKMHKMRSESNFWFKCLKPNCHSTFARQRLLNTHMRVHNNEVDYCQYCPYRYVEPTNYANHLNKHFRIMHKCHDCGSMFTTKDGLTEHSTIHEGIIYCCLICKTYEIARKNTMQVHLRKKHSDIFGENIHWDTVKKYVKLKY